MTRGFAVRRTLAGSVPSSRPTTEQLLKRAADLMRQYREYLENFNAAVDQLLKLQAEFKAEHPPFGSRYSPLRIYARQQAYVQRQCEAPVGIAGRDGF